MNNRLQELVDRLKTVPTEHFYYGRWFSDGLKEPADLLKTEACDTTGCALGWAAVFWPEEWTYVSSTLERIKPILKTRLVADKFGYNSFKSAAEFFDISLDDAEYLFLPAGDEYKYTPKQVATKVQLYIYRNRHAA